MTRVEEAILNKRLSTSERNALGDQLVASDREIKAMEEVIHDVLKIHFIATMRLVIRYDKL